MSEAAREVAELRAEVAYWVSQAAHGDNVAARLQKELKEYKDLLKRIVNNPEARNEANGFFVTSRSRNRSGRDNPTLSSSSNFQ